MSKSISLISELVNINHGKYIVKVSANHEGVVLGTGLAAADTIELAEDRARERALAIVDFTVSPQQATPLSQPQPQPQPISSPPQPEVKSSSSVNVINSVIPETPINSQSKSVSQPESKTVETMETKPSKPSLSQPENQQDSTPKLDLTPSAKSTSELPLDSSPIVENKITKPSSDKTAKQESVIENLDNSHSSKKNEETESLPTLPIEFPPETPEKKNEETESPSTLPIEFPPETPESDTEKENETLAQPQQFEDKPQEEDKTQEEDLSSNNVIDFPTSNPPEKPVINNQESPSYNLEETMDFTQIIDETTIEMKRLNWTHDQGIQYLLETYGKKSRHLLSDEELIEFLNYLKTQ